ncbi:MAG TPA: PDR/VanB family oxidoreductase [Burkholderiaceae bacterium]
MHQPIAWRPARVRALRTLSPTVREFELEPEGGALPWTVGSHIQVRLPIDGHIDTRSYSLVGEPGQACYRIAVKRVEASRGGSRTMWQLAAGETLEVLAPQNQFELSTAPPQSLLVAGGIGITPLLGMALALASRGADFTLVHATRSRDELVYTQALAASFGERLNCHVSAEAGRLQFDPLIAGLHPQGQMLLCGPLPMLEAARQAWARAGRPPHLLRFETFGSGGTVAAQAFWVRLPRHGVEFVVPPERSLLDVLEQHGLETLSDCRRGECGLCTLDVIELHGTLDHRDVFLSDAQKREGRRLCSCVSRVVGGGVVLDTDWRDDAAAARS